MSFNQPLTLRTLFVDFNAYFASVALQTRPELRGKPVGVVPVMAESSCCIAASYEAKRFGVKTGTGVREARPALYVEFHHRAVKAIDTIAPVRQVLSVDELECELTGRWRERDRAMLIAEQIKHVIWRDVGDYLRVSIGIAPNTLLGKLASDMQKPDGLTVIDPDRIPAAFIHLPVSAFSGIGPRMTKRLELAGITTMQALFDAPRGALHRIWGGVLASKLLELAKPLSVGMVFYGLVPEAQHTPSWFDTPALAGRKPHAELLRSMDALNAQFGKNTLYYAASHGALDRAPMRIAFTRIPNVETEL